MGLVLDRPPLRAFLVPHECPVLRRTGDADVVGDDDRSGVQPSGVEDASQIREVGSLVVVGEDEVEASGREAVLVLEGGDRRAAVAQRQMRRAIAALSALNSTEYRWASGGMARTVRKAL